MQVNRLELFIGVLKLNNTAPKWMKNSSKFP